MTRSVRAARFAAPAGGCVLLVVLAGCGSAGPLQALSSGGQPTVGGASVDVAPGRSADFTAFIVNPLNVPIRLVSARLVRIPGHLPAGELLHVGISTTLGMAGAATGWPIPGLPTRPLPGALVGHGQSDIIFGITGPEPGRNYYAAGLRIGYQYQGATYYVTAWSAAVACVTTRPPARTFDPCPHAAERAQAMVEHMAGST